jgi:phosphodiester glycosidase
VSGGRALGPASYDAKHGAFIASPGFAAVHDLGNRDWRDALDGADDAMVSYPLLVTKDGTNRVTANRDWLANRSFVGQDISGHIIIGTTADALFSLDRLAEFLQQAPLNLTIALNLDGGGVACQGIAVKDYRRTFCGKWELNTRDGGLKVFTWTYGDRPWALPIALAAVRK